jgi:hypothetical protein
MPNQLAPTRPAAQTTELDYLVGTFDCEGEVLATPFSDRTPLKRTLSSKRDLDGHWLFMRIDEAATSARPQPVSGNWQLAFDRSKGCFVGLWSDNLGRWAVQTSPGWEGDSLAFTGDTLVDGKPGSVRDTLTRRSADEMLFVVEFRIDGAWTRYLESACRRRRP